MEKKQISGLVSIIISAVIAIAALWGYNIVVVQPMAEQVAQNTADLYGTEAQGGDRAVGDTNVTNLVAAGDVTAGGNLTVGGFAAVVEALTANEVSAVYVTGSNGVVASKFLTLAGRAPLVLTNGDTISGQLGTYVLLSSSGAVSTSTSVAISNGGTVGNVLLLQNANAADTITVDGVGGNVECKTDKVLGAGDTLMLIWNGADWNCLSLSDNS